MAGRVTSQTITRVWTADEKTKWGVNPRDLVTVAGETFVKLARSPAGFAKLVFHNSPNIPRPLPKN